MRVKLHRKKDTVLGSFTVKVSYVKTWNFYGSSLLFSTATFMIPRFWIVRAWEIWTVCLNKLVKFVFFKKVLIRKFFMKKYFSAENVFIFRIFLHVTVFIRIVVFFVFCLGQNQYAYDFPKFSLIIMLRKYAQILGTIQKIRTLWWRRGGTPQMCENVQGEGIFQEYT